jgi:hypothetical protein
MPQAIGGAPNGQEIQKGENTKESSEEGSEEGRKESCKKVQH